MKSLENEGLITEEAFVPILSGLTHDFFKLVNLITHKPTANWTKQYYSTLSQKAHALETHLDDYHARYNKKFSYFTELFALIKWFSNSGYLQKHILLRFSRYPLVLSDSLKKEFLDESKKNLDYINRAILSLIEQLYRESEAIQMDVPKERIEELVSDDVTERWLLPQNIDEEDTVQRQHIIAELATLYKNVVESLKKIHVSKDVEFESIKSQTFYEFDETKTRQFEMLIHNIQSKYDTYIKNTVVESKHPMLASLRAHASVALHLFEMSTILVHIYERHENDIRYEKTKEKTNTIIPKRDLLSALNGYVRYYGIMFFLEGEKQADAIIDAFIVINSIEVDTKNRFSIHARPLSLIAKVALHYNTPLEIEIEGQRCNAGSIMQMILLAGNNPRPEKIIFRGEDRALRDVKDLFELIILPGEEMEQA
ncbi:MAG: HPr family phosphocarrier protein, partial [Planctomycetes bacterium]|nr:HPr family phosphocarrier protein [Planctomycetota bacterium]